MSEELAIKKNENNEIAKQGAGPARQQRWLRPRYDVRQLDGGDYVLRVWMPGVDKRGASISLDNNTLSITGSRERYWDEGWSPVLRELPEGDYRLSLTLNMRVDGDRIRAHVENGILTLDLPLAEEAKPREIAIH